MTQQRVVLDANVLYGSFTRDLLLSLFAAQMYEAKWTEYIMHEWVENLLANNDAVTRAGLVGTAAKMNAINPPALIGGYEQFIERVSLPDKDDRHVVAAAMACGAQKIITWNLSDFPNRILKAFGIIAESPDKFICDLLISRPDEVVDVFRVTRLRFKAPPVSVDGFFERLRKNNCTLTALHLERYRDLL